MAKAPTRPGRHHLKGNRDMPRARRQEIGAIGGKKAQALGKYRRFQPTGDVLSDVGRASRTRWFPKAPPK